MNTLWISNTAFQDLLDEAKRVYPLETGGVLVGYVAENCEPVIVAAVGPGPKAVHRRKTFTPDHSWQCNQLDLIFDQSAGSSLYLGDWHTHPNGSPQMSWLDRRTHRAIARHPQAKTPHPLMLIGGGGPQNWHWLGHVYNGERFFGAVTKCTEVTPRSFQLSRMST